MELKSKRCERISGHFRTVFMAVLMLVVAGMALPQVAQAKMSQGGNCVGCHSEKMPTGQVTFSADVSTVALTATPAQVYNHEGTVNVSTGQTFEIDFIVQGVVRNNSDNVAVTFPDTSTWVANGGTLPPSGVGTNLATDLANWNNVWSESDAGMIGWNNPVRATRGGEPVGMEGNL